MARKTFKKKTLAKKAKRKGQRIYKVKGGWRIGKASKRKKTRRKAKKKKKTKRRKKKKRR